MSWSTLGTNTVAFIHSTLKKKSFPFKASPCRHIDLPCKYTHSIASRQWDTEIESRHWRVYIRSSAISSFAMTHLLRYSGSHTLTHTHTLCNFFRLVRQSENKREKDAFRLQRCPQRLLDKVGVLLLHYELKSLAFVHTVDAVPDDGTPEG